MRTVLERPHALRVTVFFSLPPLKSGYEPVSIPARVLLLKELAEIGLPCCWYLRPLVEEWLDEDLFRQLARELLPVVADHVILSGLVLSTEIEQQLREHNLVVPAWDRLQSGSKQTLSSAFEGRLRQILAEVATEIEQTLGPVMSHRLCGTNGNHAYGCLICGKQDRYCQLFQLHHYHETVASADNQQLKQRLREQALAMRKNAGLNINIKGVY